MKPTELFIYKELSDQHFIDKENLINCCVRDKFDLADVENYEDYINMDKVDIKYTLTYLKEIMGAIKNNLAAKEEFKRGTFDDDLHKYLSDLLHLKMRRKLIKKYYIKIKIPNLSRTSVKINYRQTREAYDRYPEIMFEIEESIYNLQSTFNQKIKTKIYKK